MDTCPGPDAWLALDGAHDPLWRHLDACPSCRALAAALVRDGVVGAPEDAGASRALVPELVGPGTKLGRFVIRGAIGAGGMGVVLEAHDPELDRTVALKVVRGLGAGSDRARERIRTEAQAMARLAHPNVVAIHELVELEGNHLIAMERVDGPDLTGWLRASPEPSRRERRRVVLEIARGLAAAHAAGVIHGDVSPRNVLVGRDGRARVTDFGLATLRIGSRVAGGTPGYQAPELAQTGVADPRADQYSFAVVASEVLDREPRFAHVLRRARATDPAQRHASMQVVVAALEHADRNLRRILARAGAVLAGVAVVALWIAEDRTPATDGPPVAQVIESALHAVARDALHDVDTLTNRGLYRAALDRLDAIERAFPLSDPRLRAALRHTRANALFRAGDSAGAIPLLEEALALSERAGDDTARVDTMLLLLNLYRERGKLEQGTALAAVAEAAVQRLPHDPMRDSKLHDLLGSFAYLRGQFAEAERHHRTMVALQEALAQNAGGKTHPLAGALQNLAMSVAAQPDRAPEARQLFERSLAMLEATAGRDHPDTALPTIGLATIAINAGQLEEAARLYQRAIAVWERSLGPEHPNLSEPLVSLGFAESRLGRHEAALAHLRRACKLARGFGDQHPIVAIAELRLSQELGANDEALQHAEESVAIWDRNPIAIAEASQSRFLLARLLWPTGQRARARRLAARAHADSVALRSREAPEIARWIAAHR